MRIGIVGGGASAVCVLDALARSGRPGGQVTVFDPAPQLWRGRAYQHDTAAVLVNSPAEDMSVRQGDDGHYERWLARRGVTTSFASRTVYGDYLEETARQGIGRLRARGWQVTLVPEAVDGALRAAGRLVLHTAGGPHAPFDHVVLAVGGGRPRDHYGLAGRPHFVADPYPLAATLHAFGADDEVAVIGTGLTAVDVVLGLAARGHRGPVTLLSRHGVLPAVRQRPIHHRLRYFVPARLHAMAGRGRHVSLADVIALLRGELTEAGADPDDVWQEILRTGQEAPPARLRRQLGDVDCERIGLRVLQQAVHVCGPDLWPLLSEQVRQDILGRHHRTLMSLCCPMPASSAQTLLGLLDSGRLRILGGVRAVAPLAGGGFHVTAQSARLVARHVVNGVSAPAHRIPLPARRLVNALYAERLAMPHPDGGLCVETATSRLVGSGAANPGIYAIGDIAGGTFFFTFGIPSLVDRCHDIVTDILTTRRSRAREESRV
ncbi:FAD/NAD(P)-binding protein [Streptomyces sp. PU-14G]|uniref:FAD/NAD(P)-binding protein n=1 Tax=Streptomyces sp. PU-14G TaxID=2800808 RepID=UPI0034DE61F9